MNNPNLSTLENTIKKLNEDMRKETLELNNKHKELETVDADEKKLHEDIKRHEDEIKVKTNEITLLKQQIINATRKIESNKSIHNKLKQEIDTSSHKHNQNLAELARSQQEYTQSLKQSGVKIKQ